MFSRPCLLWKQVQHEIVNVLCVLQRCIKFLARRFKKTEFVRIAIGDRIRCQGLGGVFVFLKRRIYFSGLLNDFAKVVDFFKGDFVKDKKTLQGFFRRLLAVIDTRIQMTIGQSADLVGRMQVTVGFEQPGAG